MHNYLNKLNTEQRIAATTIKGPLLIIAGAGTGKTKTLISRCMYMLEHNVSAKSILLITFTNKAAKEMKQRVVSEIGLAGNDITACTYHSFCASLLRQYIKYLNNGINNSFGIIDSADALNAISICRQEYIANSKKDGIIYQLKKFPSNKMIQAVYEKSVNDCVTVGAVLENYFTQSRPYFDEIKEILNDYKNYKITHNLVDYNDLLFFVYKLLKNNKGLREHLDKKYKYIMCDEFQDTNIIQANILYFLAENENNIAVVGDDNQSIYAFRGANIANILNFKDKFHAKEIILKENYRSTNEILNFTNVVMQQAEEGIPKELHGQCYGIKPKIIITPDTYHQNQYIIRSVQKMQRQGLKLNNIAVICRSAAQTYHLELELNKIGIPYEKFGGIKFFEKATVKDVIAFVKVLLNSKDELSWFRILQHYHGIGQGYANKIAKCVCNSGIEVLDTLYSKRSFSKYLIELKNELVKLQKMDINEQLFEILNNYYPLISKREVDESDMDETKKWDLSKKIESNISKAMALLELAKPYSSAEKFLNDIILDSTVDLQNGEFLNITTIHSAKGLEYDVVFMPDVIEEITPKYPKGSPEDPEELRCFYVALTRAKSELYLFCPKFSTSIYKPIVGVPSHFLTGEAMKCCSIEKI